VALLVKNPAAFVQRYGSGRPVIGQYDGNLSNGGENLLLLDDGRPVLDVTYGASAPWPTSADGGGPSLELRDWNADFNSSTNWQASLESGGTPGRVGEVLRIESIRLEGQRLILRFTARANARYTLSHKPNLNTPDWTPVSELPSDSNGGSREFDEPVSNLTQQSYYRISTP
jgi:hypothetical protein